MLTATRLNKEQFIKSLRAEFRTWLREKAWDIDDFRNFLKAHYYPFDVVALVELDTTNLQIYRVQHADSREKVYVAFDVLADAAGDKMLFGEETVVEWNDECTPYPCDFWWWVRHSQDGEGPSLHDYIALMIEDGCSPEDVATTLLRPREGETTYMRRYRLQAEQLSLATYPEISAHIDREIKGLIQAEAQADTRAH